MENNQYLQNTVKNMYNMVNELENRNNNVLVEFAKLKKEYEEQRKMIEYLKKSMKEINNQIIVERSMGKGV